MKNMTVSGLTFEARKFGPVSFSVGTGEIVLVCGLSGSGKSTLCDLLAGRLEADSGVVEGLGQETLGYVTHDFENQLIGSTVAEELELGASEFSPGKRRVDEVEKALKILLEPLRDLLDHDPHKLAPVLQQKLLLACLVRSGARLLVLDECLSQMGLQAKAGFKEVLQILVASGFAVLLISHDRDLLSIADRVLVMDKGKLSFVGAPRSMDDGTLRVAGMDEELFLPLARVESKTPGSSPLRLRFAHRQIEVVAGEALVLGGEDGSQNTHLLIALFAGLVEAGWSVENLSEKRCLLRQLVGPSFWRGSIAQEIEVSLGLFQPLPERLKNAILEALPDDWMARSPQSLSHGQMRYFGALCLLAQNPEILFLDRPRQGLDGPLRKKLATCLGTFLVGGGRVVVTSDNKREVPGLGQKVVWMVGDEVGWVGETNSAEWKKASDNSSLGLP